MVKKHQSPGAFPLLDLLTRVSRVNAGLITDDTRRY